MLQGGDLKDQILKSYIEQIFNKYDTDRSGTLDQGQMTKFFNDLFQSLNINMIVTDSQALEAIKSIDANFDGKVDKEELFNAFKIMINQPNIPPPQPNYQMGQQAYGYGYQGGYNNYQQNMYQNPYGTNQMGGSGYMNQSNPYISPNSGYTNPYNNPYVQHPPQNGYMGQQGSGYMNQSNTGYMNQSSPYQNPYQNQYSNPYNPYKK